jgi:hypothetical protein
MLFVLAYPNVVAADKFIDRLITLLSDAQYQAGALAEYAAPGEPLAPYVLVSESAVWREDMETPALLVKDVTTESKEGDGPLLNRTHRFSVYQMLSAATTREGEAALMREASRRATAVEMMIRSARGSGFDLLAGTGIRAGEMSIQLNYGDTMPGKASYFRFPSVSVEVPTLEGQ